MRDEINIKKGFTLVELAIVIIIVGLIVAGTLAGQSLIEQAQIQKQIKTIREIDLTYKTFQLKYNALPGDISEEHAMTFFNSNPCSTGIISDLLMDHNISGNEDGLIRTNTYPEHACVWQHLFQSGFYQLKGPSALSLSNIPPFGLRPDEDPTPLTDVDFSVDTGYYFALWPAYDNAIVEIQAEDDLYDLIDSNVLHVRGFSSNFMPPENVHSMDTKLDDGRPGTGNFMALSWETEGCFSLPDTNYPIPSSEYILNETLKSCSFIYGLK